MTTSATTSNMNAAAPDAQPEVAALTQTDDAKAVSKLGAPISRKEQPSDSINSGMSISSQVSPTNIKDSDSKTLQGSHAGDHRAQAAQPVLPPQRGPREQMEEAPLSGKQSPTSAPEPTADTSGID